MIIFAFQQLCWGRNCQDWRQGGQLGVVYLISQVRDDREGLNRAKKYGEKEADWRIAQKIKYAGFSSGLGQSSPTFVVNGTDFFPTLLLLLLSSVRLFCSPMDSSPQAPLSMSMGFPRQEYQSGLPFPFIGDLPDPGIEPMSPALAGRFFTTEPSGKPSFPQQRFKRKLNMCLVSLF